jgi:hypothetical protein
MLPLYNERCLIDRWIEMLSGHCSKIIIACSPATLICLEHININSKKVHLKNVGTTISMNETIMRGLEHENYETVIMVMPDTYVDFFDTECIKTFEQNDEYAKLYLWKIRKSQLGKIGQCKFENNTIVDIIDKNANCEYIYGWGAMLLKKDVILNMNREDSHTGYTVQHYIKNNKKIGYIINNGNYYDCGTFGGYKECINELP